MNKQGASTGQAKLSYELLGTVDGKTGWSAALVGPDDRPGRASTTSVHVGVVIEQNDTYCASPRPWEHLPAKVNDAVYGPFEDINHAGVFLAGMAAVAMLTAPANV